MRKPLFSKADLSAGRQVPELSDFLMLVEKITNCVIQSSLPVF